MKLTTAAVILFAASVSPAQIKVCATVPDLGNLVAEVGGSEVSVEVFAKPGDDPHFVEAKPGFIKSLSTADLLVAVGLELEVGWLPAIVTSSRNAKVQPGGRGYLDVSTAIQPLEVPTGTIDRSMGDVHAAGNPHYLVDPLNGLKVAAAIRDRLAELKPGSKQEFDDRFKAFRQKLGDALVGAELAKKYDFEKLALLHEHGKLGAFLEGRKDQDKLGGWLKTMVPSYGVKAVADHNLWPYFAKRFGIEVIGFFEPKPGVPPTTGHLTGLVKTMQGAGVKLILAAPYYDRKHAELVAGQTGAKVAAMAHQVGSRPGATDYLAMVDQNVKAVGEALKK